MKASRYEIAITSFGVDIVLRTNAKRVADAIPNAMDSALARMYAFANTKDAKHSFNLNADRNGRIEIFQEGELKAVEKDLKAAMSRIEAAVRLKVAECAVGKVFLHSGAVGWKGKGIIFPGRSFHGKSTLTAALVRLGAKYYSDEYAVIDDRGRLYPFPKDLSLRGPSDQYFQIDHSVESIGGKSGKRPIAIRLIVLTQFATRARWQPRRLTEGQAVLGVLDNAVAIRRDPSFVLPVLSKLCGSATTIKSKRGDADVTAKRLIEILGELD